MKDPVRLLESLDDELALQVLASAKSDAPSDESRAALFAALGVATLPLVPEAPTPTLSAIAQAPTSAWWVPLAKWAAVVGVGIGAVVFVMRWGTPKPYVAQSRLVVNPLAKPMPEAVPVAASPIVPVTVEATVVEEEVKALPHPVAVKRNEVPMAKSPPVVANEKGSDEPKTSNAAALREELDLLEQADRASQGGRPDEALERMKTYDKKFKSGALAVEAKVIAVESLSKKGDKKAAEQALRQLKAMGPSLQHVERAERALSGGK